MKRNTEADSRHEGHQQRIKQGEYGDTAKDKGCALLQRKLQVGLSGILSCGDLLNSCLDILFLDVNQLFCRLQSAFACIVDQDAGELIEDDHHRRLRREADDKAQNRRKENDDGCGKVFLCGDIVNGGQENVVPCNHNGKDQKNITNKDRHFEQRRDDYQNRGNAEPDR